MMMEPPLLPMGYGFNPKDGDIIQFLLDAATSDAAIPGIRALDVYSIDPWEIPDHYFNQGPMWNEAFFLTPRHRSSSKSGVRAKRTSRNGVWHGNNRAEIKSPSGVLCYRAALTFKRNEGEKKGGSRWIMQEYILHSEQFQELGICRIHRVDSHCLKLPVVAEEEVVAAERPRKKPRTTATKEPPAHPTSKSGRCKFDEVLAPSAIAQADRQMCCYIGIEEEPTMPNTSSAAVVAVPSTVTAAGHIEEEWTQVGDILELPPLDWSFMDSVKLGCETNLVDQFWESQPPLIESVDEHGFSSNRSVVPTSFEGLLWPLWDC